VTVVRLGDRRLWLVVAVGRHLRDRKWLTDHLPADGSLVLTDLSSAWCSVGTWGPRSTALIGSVARNAGGWLTAGASWAARQLEVGTVRALAVRTPRLGGPGWELFAPMEQGLQLWDTLWEAGRPLGTVAAGLGVSSIGARHEAGLASRTFELIGGYDLAEAGLARPAKAADFVGKAAYIEQLAREPAARLCRLVVEDHRSSDGRLRYPMGGEPLLTRSGEPLVDARGRRSFATSAGSDPIAGCHRLFGYLPAELAVEGAELAVEYFGERYPVRVTAVGAVHPATLGES